MVLSLISFVSRALQGTGTWVDKGISRVDKVSGYKRKQSHRRSTLVQLNYMASLPLYLHTF